MPGFQKLHEGHSFAVGFVCKYSRRVIPMDRYLQENFKKSMKIRLNFNNMMKKFVGEEGLEEADLEKLAGKIDAMEKAMVEKRKRRDGLERSAL